MSIPEKIEPYQSYINTMRRYEELLLDSKYYTFQLTTIPTKEQLNNIELLIESRDLLNINLVHEIIDTFYKPLCF